MIRRLWMVNWKGCARRWCIGLFQDIVLAFAWKYWGNSWGIWVRIANLWAKIWIILMTYMYKIKYMGGCDVVLCTHSISLSCLNILTYITGMTNHRNNNFQIVLRTDHPKDSVLSQHLHGGTKKNHKASVKVVCLQAKNWHWNLLIIQQEC